MTTILDGVGVSEAGTLGALRYFTIERAAERLCLNPDALRARCRRRAKREGRQVVADLGGGIVAIKFGVSWRVRFPD